MKFSIIIPLYNKQQTIRRALYSAYDQVNSIDGPIEIIVVDDGSTDNSVQEVINVQDEIGTNHIRLLEQANQGVSSARNHGVAVAKSEMVAFLDADDTYKPTFLSTIERLIEGHPECDLFGTAYEFICCVKGSRKPARLAGVDKRLDTQRLENFFVSAVRGDLPFCSSSFCVRKKIFLQNGGFPEGESMGEDQSFFSQIALRHNIAFSPNICANYYIGVSNSLMQTEKVTSEMPFAKRLQKLIDQKKVPPKLRQAVKKYIAGHIFDIVRRNFVIGNFKTARNLLSDQRLATMPIKWLYWSCQSAFR